MNAPPTLARLAGRPLAKMDGIGNAIVVLDLRGVDLVPTPDEAQAIDALPGLAFDQLMAIRDPTAPGTDAAVLIYNKDGSRVGACGNGTRCVAWYLSRGSDRAEVILTSDAGRLVCRREGERQVSVDMGRPTFRWDEIPLAEPRDTDALDLGVADTLGRAVALGIGNPHAVFFVPDADAVDLPRVGPGLEHASIFPERANISFAQMRDPGRIKLRVWERGAGATLACGTGACATLVAAAKTGRSDRRAVVELPGGPLVIDWCADDRIRMTGPVALHFETVLDTAGALDAVS